MEEVLGYSALVGAFVPLVISFIKRAGWSVQQKKLLSVVIAVVAAVATVIVAEGSLDFELLLASAGTIFALAKTSYDGWWETTTVDATLTRVMS